MLPELKYQSGLGNHVESEAVPGSLPQGQNSPQMAPHGLYAEQLSGTSFCAPRSENLRTWQYRILPSVRHQEFRAHTLPGFETAHRAPAVAVPQQLRWNPLSTDGAKLSFLESLMPWLTTDSAGRGFGAEVYLYRFGRNEPTQFFYSADGDFLFVPWQGSHRIETELGSVAILPGEIALVPRGIKFRVTAIDGICSGYICENLGSFFRLPTLGVIGANGLAAARDFLIPQAQFEDLQGKFSVIAKVANRLWMLEQDHSPLCVVAWHGNYYPFKYDLSRFNTIGTVSFDHPDPSIFTVLTSPSSTPGTANLDFVIFPPRWMVAEHTFRPPYYHRNCMSEYMGLIQGTYDAKPSGFQPGGGSLHNSMSAHGPDAGAFGAASSERLEPKKLEQTMAFMFETNQVFRVYPSALQHPTLDRDYSNCWATLPRKFPAIN